jgi:hypothetical protein
VDMRVDTRDSGNILSPFSGLKTLFMSYDAMLTRRQIRVCRRNILFILRSRLLFITFFLGL